MQKILLLAFAAAALSVPAMAQVTTNCSTYGSNTNCTTTGIPAPNPLGGLIMRDTAGDAMRAYQQGQAVRAERLRQEQMQREAMQVAADRAEAEAAQARRAMGLERMGALVTAGRCQEATELAFSMGAADMVQAIAAACKPSLDPVGAILRAAQAGTPANLALPPSKQ